MRGTLSLFSLPLFRKSNSNLTAEAVPVDSAEPKATVCMYFSTALLQSACAATQAFSGLAIRFENGILLSEANAVEAR